MGHTVGSDEPRNAPQARSAPPPWADAAGRAFTHPVYSAAQPAYVAWGVVPSAPPRARLAARTVAAVCGLLALVFAVVIAAVVIAAPGGGQAARPTTGPAAQDVRARALWRSVPADDLLPGVIKREGTEAYVRLGVDPDQTCQALPTAFTAALGPAKCAHVLQATYIDLTQTVTATVGIVVLSGTNAARLGLYQSWTGDADAAKTDMMPHAYAVPGSPASGFGDAQRVAWQSQVSTDGSYLVFTVAGFADGRTGPDAAARAAGSGSALAADSPPVQVAGDVPAGILDKLTAQQGAVTKGPAS